MSGLHSKKSGSRKSSNHVTYFILKRFLVAQWINNAEALFVSTVHTKTQHNNKHVRVVLGKDGTKTIKIPKIVNDYNNQMYGIDLADQLISYNKPKFTCRHIWVPLFLQTMDIVGTNSYKAAKAMGYKKEWKQLMFSWIKELNPRAY